jgi:hypothetical protein
VLAVKPATARIAILAISTLCFCVFLVTRSRGEKTVEGIYQTGPEQSAFFVDGNCSQMPFWITWPDRLDTDSEKRMWSVGKPEALRVKVRATISPAGMYGHLGGYAREVQVLTVISADAAAPCPWPGERSSTTPGG